MTTYPITPPNCPVPRAQTPRMRFATGMTSSPFTGGGEKTFRWSGDRWLVDFVLPEMSPQNAALWRAFFLKLEGKHGTFRYHIPEPEVRGSGTLTLSGSARATTATVSGTGTMPVGSYFQVGDHLYSVVSELSGGSVEFRPGLRTDQSNAAVNVTNPTGIWRLRTNEVAFGSRLLAWHEFPFEAQEAL